MTTPTTMHIARKAMIDSQLRTSGVNTPFVLTRMGSVPREDFVPDAARGVAYIDRAVPLGDGKFLGAPVMHGLMLEAADPQTDDNVLIVEGGSAYFEELIRPLVSAVTSITPADALKNSRKKDRYALLIVDGAVQALPDALLKRLDEGARIVTGIIDGNITKVMTGRKSGETASLRTVQEVGMPHLTAFDRKKEWAF